MTEKKDKLELYKKYRPRLLKHVKGQDSAVKVLNTFMKNGTIPHTLLFSGPSGCGKTTIGRILKSKLNCGDSDFAEVNCADDRGIDMVRDIRSRMGLRPMTGDCRIWLIDEAHQMSSQAQNAFLKILEDTPRHVYFFLCTTAPEKLIKTIKTRCTQIHLSPLSAEEIGELVDSTAEAEGKELDDDIRDKIINIAQGSARQALVSLHAVIDLETKEEQIKALEGELPEMEAVMLARALINPKTNWQQIAEIIREIKADPEQLRYLVLGYASAVLLSQGKKGGRAYLVVDAFRDNFYDSKRAGLIAACYEVIVGQ